MAAAHAATVVVGQFPHPDDAGELLEDFAGQLAIAFNECHQPMIAFTTPALTDMSRHFTSPPGVPRIVRSLDTAYSIRSHHREFGSWDWWAEHASHQGAQHLPAEAESNALAAWNGQTHIARLGAAANPFHSRSIWYFDAGSFDRYDDSHLELLDRRYHELTTAFSAPDAIIIFSVATFTGAKCVRVALDDADRYSHPYRGLYFSGAAFGGSPAAMIAHDGRYERMCEAMLARRECVRFRRLESDPLRFIGNDEVVLQQLYRAEPGRFIVVELSPTLNPGMLGEFRQTEHGHRALQPAGSFLIR